jgi:hypothetical protein
LNRAGIVGAMEICDGWGMFFKMMPVELSPNLHA